MRSTARRDRKRVADHWASAPETCPRISRGRGFSRRRCTSRRQQCPTIRQRKPAGRPFRTNFRRNLRDLDANLVKSKAGAGGSQAVQHTRSRQKRNGFWLLGRIAKPHAVAGYFWSCSGFGPSSAARSVGCPGRSRNLWTASGDPSRAARMRPRTVTHGLCEDARRSRGDGGFSGSRGDERTESGETFDGSRAPRPPRGRHSESARRREVLTRPTATSDRSRRPPSWHDHYREVDLLSRCRFFLSDFRRLLGRLTSPDRGFHGVADAFERVGHG